jgi:hypothetical protein
MLEIVPAHLAVQAMRDNGYKNAAYALAELIDNSIQAGATQVELLCAERTERLEQRSRARIHQIAVLDNGCGMDAEVLKIALQFGNGTRLEPAAQTGIGRFGMGLPSASISQCTRVEVWSWQDGITSALYTYLDVDKIRSGEQRGIPEPRRAAIPAVWYDVGEAWGVSGTLVVWSNLDRIIWRTAQAIIDNSEQLVGRMYRRFLEHNRVRIRMVKFDWDGFNGFASEQDAKPNDPLYLMRGTSTPEPYDLEPMFAPWGEPAEIQHTVRFRGEEHIVTTRFSMVRPEARSGDNAGARAHGQHAAKNIGVSVMRAGRELDLEQAWTIKYDPRERWWGMEIEFPPALDELFGVTNNKQAARNFSELARLEKEDFMRGGSLHAAMEELEEAEDPRAPLLEIAHRIRSNLDRMRAEIKAQQIGERSKVTPAAPVDQALQAVSRLTRERQDQGYLGVSDRDEQLDAAERTQTIERTLIDAGVDQQQAQQLAAATVNDGLKYTFAAADLDTPAFFTVKARGGALVITLNINHPAYEHLIGLLDDTAVSAQAPAERLRHAGQALRILLMAWARYEDEQPEQRRQHAQDMRNDWGRIARRFLSGISDE